MQKRSDEKVITYNLDYKHIAWVDNNTFELRHNKCIVISNIRLSLDGVLTSCNYKELNPNVLLIYINKNDNVFKTAEITIFSEQYTTSYKIKENPGNQSYLTFSNVNDTINESTEIVMKSHDGWVYTNTQFTFKNETLEIQIPQNIIYPIQILIINNKIDVYPQLF